MFVDVDRLPLVDVQHEREVGPFLDELRPHADGRVAPREVQLADPGRGRLDAGVGEGRAGGEARRREQKVLGEARALEADRGQPGRRLLPGLYRPQRPGRFHGRLARPGHGSPAMGHHREK